MKPDKKPKRNFHKKLNKKSQQEANEIAELERVIAEQAPARGTNPLLQQPAAPGEEPQQQRQEQQQHQLPTLAAARKFEELPISRYSKEALREAKYVTMTAIQRAALPHVLCGRDVLGAAKTGSGKTLAFLLPVLEKLYRAKWTKYDGLGALVISPTRELALQIFDELRKVGRRHELSAGLLIGGKDVREEQARVNGMNILVCTPGRLLQHMDETPGFDASNLLMLVLDEADRILDMGFSATLNAIVANIPRSRQTLLFSATQTKSVKDLARLSLRDPEYVSVHAEAAAPTPLKLQQAYMVCPLQDKVDILWSFIKTHLKAKVIVFVSTCKQVRFFYEAFRKLRPGVPLRALHGRMNQYKRMGVFYEFCESKAMALFATDIAARGLDFPAIDWVVQADCPEDVASYIHRVGRTARYVHTGRALLLLLPSESEGMLKQLEEARVPVKQMKHNPAKLQPVTPALQALLSKDTELKETAQRALISYLRSVFLQPNHAVFDVTALPAAEFAHSMGLPTAPKLRFLRRAGKKVKEITVGGPATEEEAQLLGGDAGAAAEPSSAGKDSSGQPGAAGGAASKKGRRQDSQARSADKAVNGAANGHAAVPRGVEDDADGVSGSEREGEASEAEVDDDDDDDLLVVKRRDVYGVADELQQQQLEGQQAAAAAAAAEEAAVGRKRKKRLRIDPGRGPAAGGSRVVFDEEGQAVDPLELLAQGGDLGGSGDEQAGEAAAGQPGREGLHVGIHGSVAERAAAARALMAQRDRMDKEKLKELRKTMRDEKKAKRKAREGGLPTGATLAREGGESSDYGSDESEGEGASSGSEGPAHRRVRQPAARSDSDSDAGVVDVDLLESSDDEEPGYEPATLGMRPAQAAAQQQRSKQQRQGSKRRTSESSEEVDGVDREDGLFSSDESDSEGGAPPAAAASGRLRVGQGQPGSQGKKAKVLDKLTLADQEALALQLLSGKR